MNEIQKQIVALIPKLRRYARALTQDKESADDLVQDALERALTRIELWKRGTDMRAWLFTIMHNVYVNSVKKNSRGGLHIPIDGTMEELSYSDSQIGSIELNECLKALNALPLEQREIIVLVAVEGLSYSQVATVVDVPVGTVMSRLSRARKAIRTLVGDES